MTAETVALALGPWLFLQAALIRLPEIRGSLRAVISASDEIILVMLVGWVVLRAVRRPAPLIVPRALIPIVGFVIVGGISAVLNAVAPAQALSGMLLGTKAAAWFFVFANLVIDVERLVRYYTFIGVLFFITAAIGLAQWLGLDVPWVTHTRRTGEVAATSIWNQHTVFGSAMAIGVGLAVAAISLPRTRRQGFALLVATSIGVVISTVRRLHVALPVSALIVIVALGQWRGALDRSRAVVRRVVADRRWLLAALGGIVLAAALIIPYGVRMGASLWDEYVVDAADRDRYELYGGAATLLARSPLVGRGPGTYGSWASIVFDSPAYAEAGVSLPDRLKTGAPYASLAAEFGLAGTLLFFAFIVMSFRTMIAIARSVPETVRGALATGVAFLIVDFAIESVVHIAFVDSFAAYFAFGTAGLVLASAPPERSAIQVVLRRQPDKVQQRRSDVDQLGGSLGRLD
ncbi:MAG TPA: hypothetical protein VFO05_05475 [Candidatus Limnocylindrales bacterium]|nr:hypothetical protein [Candidatus Limnocylindrales bacterium]